MSKILMWLLKLIIKHELKKSKDHKHTIKCIVDIANDASDHDHE